MKSFDALVIGAGPAGTSCALALSKRGWRVVIIDKSTFPRHKTCGSFIGPENRALLIEFGVWDKLLQEGACVVDESFVSSSKGASTTIPIEGVALGVSRKVLDVLLLKRVKAAGIEVYEGAQARNIYNHGKGFDVALDHYADNKVFNLNVRHIIDASGQQSPSSKVSKIQLGLAALYENIPQASRRVMLHCCQGGHVGINPFENNQVNVCYVVESEHFKRKGNNADWILMDWMRENPHLKSVMSESRRVSAWKAVHIPVRSSVVLFENGIWRVGNSAAFIDTVLGAGISVALQGGQILAESLTELSHDVQRVKVYSKAYRQRFSGQRRLASVFGNLVQSPWVADATIRLLDANNKIRRALMNYSRPGFDVEYRKGVFSEI